MTLDKQHVWTLLRDLDDPDHMESPHGYDHAATRARFDKLARPLDQRFDCTYSADRDVQDASHHGTIIIPATATASRDHITVTVSNVGKLVAATLGNPGSYDHDETLARRHRPEPHRQRTRPLSAHWCSMD
jgi:hypothetical protein